MFKKDQLLLRVKELISESVLKTKYFFILLIGLSLLGVAALYPIYPDEITNIFLTGRNGIGDGLKLWLTPACTLKPIYIPPPLLYVYELIGQVFDYILTHRSLRATSLFLSFIVFGFWYWLVRNKGTDKNLILILIILTLPPIFINSFVYLRPEKYLLFFLVLSIYLNIYSFSKKKTLTLYSLVFMVGIINHPKAYYFLPLYLYILFRNIGPNNLLVTIYNLVLLGIVSVAAWQNYFLSLETYICEPIPFIRNFISNYALNPGLILKDPAEFFYKLFLFNDFSHTYRAISQFFIRSNYDIGYLPDLINLKFEYLFNLPIFYIVIKTLYKLLISLYKNDIFYIIYSLLICVIYLFSGNKGAYDTAFIVTSLLLIIPFSVRGKISFSKPILSYFIILILYSYIIIILHITSLWSGPGTQILKKIDYSSIDIKIKNHINNYNNILYDDNTALLFNGIKEKYPVTYINNLATRENELVRSNLRGKTFLYVGRCVYLDSMRALQDDVIITTYEKFTVQGVSDVYKKDGLLDYLCISEVR